MSAEDIKREAQEEARREIAEDLQKQGWTAEQVEAMFAAPVPTYRRRTAAKIEAPAFRRTRPILPTPQEEEPHA